MRNPGYILTAVLLFVSATFAGAQDVSRQRLENNVKALSADPAAGRKAGSEEGLAAAEYIAGVFEQAGLTPYYAGQYIDEFTAEPLVGTARKTYRNVAGIIYGSSLELDGDYIIVGAHYDFAGTGGSANTVNQDNVTGVASLLEMAAAVKECSPGRNVVFVAFDGYEQGLLGSRRFMEESTVPADNMVIMLDLGLIPVGDKLYYYVNGVSQKELNHLVTGDCAFEVSVIESEYNGRTDTEPFTAAGVASVYVTTDQPEPESGQTVKTVPVNVDFLSQVTSFVAESVCDMSRDAAIERSQKIKERRPIFSGGISVLAGTSFYRQTDGDMRGKTLFSGGAGVYGQLNMWEYLGLRPEVQYIHSGTRYETGKMRMNSVVVPVSLTIQTPASLSASFQLQLLAGGYYRRTFSGSDLPAGAGNNSEILFSNGAGVHWGLNLRMKHIGIGVVSRYGLTDLYRSEGGNLRERATYCTISYNF